MGIGRYNGQRTVNRSGVSGGGVSRPHNCMSPGCSRRGEMETVAVFAPKTASTIAAATKQAANPVAPDPDPFEFTILKSFSEGGFTLAQVNYHGCINYEGQKILLFRKDIGSLVILDHLDPHFLETDENGLLARFIPTDEGWKLGLGALKSLL